MGIDFTPQNLLEEGIRSRDIKMILQAIAEEETLDRLAAASNLGDERFPDEVVFSVLFIAVTREQVRMMTSGWFAGFLRAGERLRHLVDEVLTPLPRDPSPGEKALIKAVVYGENEEICRLIREEQVRFEGFAPELLPGLPALSKEAALTFLKEGLSPKLKAVVLGILLKEVENPDLLDAFSAEERTRYANLMLHIVAGEKITAQMPWFPEKGEYTGFYYFDPEHTYSPGEN